MAEAKKHKLWKWYSFNAKIKLRLQILLYKIFNVKDI